MFSRHRRKKASISFTNTHSPTQISILIPTQPDALHASRLLNVEERILQRVTKNILPKASPLRTLPVNPSSNIDTTRLRSEILLDFAALSNSLLRIQLLSASNARERARLADSKTTILQTAQAVREDTVSLRAQLVEAQQVLERRKGYDRLAATVLEDRKLKGREEASAEIERLEREMEGLRSEGREVEEAWVGRKEGFERVVREGEALRRIMRGDVKEEEGEGEKEEEEGEGEGEESIVDTPGVGDRTPLPGSLGEGGETPLPEGMGEAGDGTPLPPSSLTNRFLEVEDSRLLSSGAASPLRHEVHTPKVEDDVDMEASAVEVEETAGDTMDET